MKNKSLLYKAFNKKKVLITGHTGFKGTWLTSWLKILGANIVGISVDIPTKPSHFEKTNLSKEIIDLRMDINSINLKNKINKFKPDFIFHLAAQSLVTESHEDPLKTWKTNVLGTANLLNSLKSYKKSCVAVFITSDKCYDNKEWAWGYRETDKLGGSDPYSGSKASAEILINSFVKSFFSKNHPVKIASVRAGNVIGGGDWSPHRIIPDVISAWSNKKPVKIRNPGATRPWQHVLEPLSGYLTLAAQMSKNNKLQGETFNFGPNDNQIKTVRNVVNSIYKFLPKKALMVKKGSNKNNEHHFLKLNCDKALNTLKWIPTLNFDETIEMTMEWYLSYYKNPKNIHKKTVEQIKKYEELAKARNVSWS